MNDAPSARQFRESFGEGLLSLGTSDWNGSVCDGRAKVAEQLESATEGSSPTRPVRRRQVEPDSDSKKPRRGSVRVMAVPRALYTGGSHSAQPRRPPNERPLREHRPPA